jgi:G3E family GTPase
LVAYKFSLMRSANISHVLSSTQTQQGHPATKLASLQRTVTLIDASTFGTDWMTWDTAGDRPSWTEPGDDCAAVRKIPELLAEQVEAADLLLVNKVDLAGSEQVTIASGLAKGLNDKAEILEVEFGKVEAKELLGTLEILKEVAKEEEHSHGHHSHDHDEKCSNPECTDESHSHSHSHEHSEACSELACTDTSHSHSHDHKAESSCSEPGCTDTSHSHSHEHSSDASCSDPDCTDESNSHSHSHSHQSTATDQLGITSFVYKQSKPFNSQRLLALLNRWPLPIKESLDLGLTMGSTEIKEGQEEEEMAFAGVLRSKGFCWMAPTKWSGGANSDGE